MRRSFKFRLRPTTKQTGLLIAMLADHRELYNAALEERRDAFRKRGVAITYAMQSEQLKDIRQLISEQERWSFCSQQATLRRLNRAFSAFFRRVHSGLKSGYPRFKGRGVFDTVEWPVDGNGCRWDSTPDGPQARVYLRGIGHVRVHRHRSIAGRVKTISVKREGNAWYVIISCDEVPLSPLPATGRQAGLDVGVTEFVALSDGTLISNPRWWQGAEHQLKSAQREHADRYPRQAPRSKRKTRSAQRVAKVHRIIARRRRDFHHKTAAGLVQRFDFIAYEKLNIKGMVRAPQPRPCPDQPGEFLPNGAKAKAGLNRLILDAAWGQFLAILVAKAENAGRLVVAVNARRSSQTCSVCMHVDAASRMGSDFRCTKCRHFDHADVNAARNHLRAGLALIQSDGSRSPA